MLEAYTQRGDLEGAKRYLDTVKLKVFLLITMALCTDCTSKIEYQGDGSQSKFTFDFEYMESSDVYVAAWDDEKKEYYNLNGSTDWRFDNATTIESGFVTCT